MDLEDYRTDVPVAAAAAAGGGGGAEQMGTSGAERYSGMLKRDGG